MSPLFDGVRADPRFKDLLRRVGLDEPLLQSEARAMTLEAGTPRVTPYAFRWQPSFKTALGSNE